MIIYIYYLFINYKNSYTKKIKHTKSLNPKYKKTDFF